MTPGSPFFLHRAKEEPPALHAAYLVITLLVAALLNFGVFLSVIILHALFDFWRRHEVHGRAAGESLRGVFRDRMWDYSLLLIGLLFFVYLHPDAMIAGGVGLPAGSVVRGIGMLIAKMGILYRFMPVVFHPRSYFASEPQVCRALLLPAERGCMFLCILAALLLVLSPVMIVGGLTRVTEILLTQFIPWKM